MSNKLRRRTEEVATGRTRNAFVEQSARGFESHRLRQMAKTALLFLFTRKREFWNPFVCFRHNRATREFSQSCEFSAT